MSKTPGMRFTPPRMRSSCLRSLTSSAPSMRARRSWPPLSKGRMFAPVSLITLVMAAARESRLGFAGPFDRNTPLGVIHQILHIRAGLAVHRDAPAASHITDDIISRDRIAAFRAIDHQVVVAANQDSAVVHAQHALDGVDDLGLLVFAGIRQRLPGSFGQNLACRPFSVAQIGVEIVNSPAAVFGRDALPVFVRNLF